MQAQYKEKFDQNAGYETKPEHKERAQAWFKGLRDGICAAFEKIEFELTGTQNSEIPSGHFEQKAWNREGGGGGVMSTMRGRVFEKVGVNISTVHGTFSEEFRAKIPGTSEKGEFWASGISVVAHPWNPHVPPVHMNTRHIITAKPWFGGAVDLNPITPNQNDTDIFHKALLDTCNEHDVADYEAFKKWCDDYFYLPHRAEHRGVGGVFYDYLNSGCFEDDFSFTQEIGQTFLNVYPKIVRLHMNRDWSAADREHQLIRRGRYVEFNLLHDRGTVFGLKTGGNTEAILMSLPPEVKWP